MFKRLFIGFFTAATFFLMGCSNPVKDDIASILEQREKENFDLPIDVEQNIVKIHSIEISGTTEKAAGEDGQNVTLHSFTAKGELTDEACVLPYNSYPLVAFKQAMGGQNISYEAVFKEGGRQRGREGALGSVLRLDRYSDDFNVRMLQKCEGIEDSYKFVFGPKPSREEIEPMLQHYRGILAEMDLVGSFNRGKELQKKVRDIKNSGYDLRSKSRDNRLRETRKLGREYREQNKKIDQAFSEMKARIWHAYSVATKNLDENSAEAKEIEEMGLEEYEKAEKKRDLDKAANKAKYDEAVAALEARDEAAQKAFAVEAGVEEMEKEIKAIQETRHEKKVVYEEIRRLFNSLTYEGLVDESEVPPSLPSFY